MFGSNIITGSGGGGGGTTNHAALSNLTYNLANHGSGYNGFLRGATLSASNPTTGDDETKGYVEGDLWVNTSSKISFQLIDKTTANAIWAQLLESDYNNLFFVAKHGLDTNSGKKENDPFLTLAHAVSVASTGDAIIILDKGIYTENFTLDGILLAPCATIFGQISQNANSYLKAYYIKNNVDDCIQSGSVTGEYYFDIDFLHVVGDHRGINHQNGLQCAKGFIKNLLIENPSSVSANGISVTTGLSPVPCDIEIANVSFVGSGSNPRVVYYSASSSAGTGRIKIGNIFPNASITNSTGIYCIGTGTLEATIESGSCTTAYETAVSSSLILVGNSNFQGSLVENSSVPIRARYGRLDAPAISATDYYYLGALSGKIEWLPLAINQTINTQSTWYTATGSGMSTPPTVAMGVQYAPLTTVHTPKTNKVKVTLHLQCTQSGASNYTTAAVFEASNLVLYVSEQVPGNNLKLFPKTDYYAVTAGIPYTFTVRLGQSFGNPVAVNGTTIATGNLKSTLIIEDIL